MQKTVKKAQKGFTLIELLIVIAVIAILAAIAIPNLLSSRKAANESSAISSVRTLISAEETYHSRYGVYGTLTNLKDKQLVDPLLGAGSKSGFVFTAAPLLGSEASRYGIMALPATPGTTGDRAFGASENGVILAAADESGTIGTPAPIQ